MIREVILWLIANAFGLWLSLLIFVEASRLLSPPAPLVLGGGWALLLCVISQLWLLRRGLAERLPVFLLLCASVWFGFMLAWTLDGFFWHPGLMKDARFDRSLVVDLMRGYAIVGLAGTSFLLALNWSLRSFTRRQAGTRQA